jgi:hypothetical protein
MSATPITIHEPGSEVMLAHGNEGFPVIVNRVEIAAGRVTYEVSWLDKRQRYSTWVDAVELRPVEKQAVPVRWFHQLSEGS